MLDCIKNPDYVNPATRPPLRRQIEDEVYHIFDFGEFSSRTVGPRWKEFSAAQKKSFSNAFADLLLTTYLNKVDGYNGEQVAYTCLLYTSWKPWPARPPWKPTPCSSWPTTTPRRSSWSAVTATPWPWPARRPKNTAAAPSSSR